MNEMKCTQCGCHDLEKVDFPYTAILDLVSQGLAGESSFYDLYEDVCATTYICTKCGHYEFFNQELAKSILEKRAKNSAIKNEIDELEKQIISKNNEIEGLKKQQATISEQLKNIDITIRQSNELKAKQKELSQLLKATENEIKSLRKQQDACKRKLKK